MKTDSVFPIKVSIVFCISVLIFSLCGRRHGATFDIEKQKAYANTLFEKELYTQAIQAYETLTDAPLVPANTKAGILFRIGAIYLENLNDPENACAVYLRIREFFPGSPVAPDAGKQIVACLEKMGRSVDARSEMSEITALKPEERTAQNSAVVAEIEGKTVTLGMIEKQDGFLEREPAKRTEQVQRYVTGELLYQSALRMGYDKNQKLQRQIKQVERNLLINRMLEVELAGVTVDSTFAEEYFKAHREQYTDSTQKEPPAFTKVRDRVLRDMGQEKQKEAYQKLMERLLRAETVKLYSDKIR
jgi:tetratricopeptide (TPR) repeat protein